MKRVLAFALEHEFRPSSFAVVRLEDLNEIANLKADLIACYKPVNSQELIAIERIALAQQAIFRGYRLEAGLFTSAFNSAVDPEDGRPIQPMHPHTVGDGDIEITRAQNRNYALAEGFRRVARESNALGLVMRYQVQAERQYRRAIEEFERLKRLRPELPSELNLQTEPDSPEDIAPLSELNGFSEPGKGNVPQALSPVEPQTKPHSGTPCNRTTRKAACHRIRPRLAPALSQPTPPHTQVHKGTAVRLTPPGGLDRIS